MRVSYSGSRRPKPDASPRDLAVFEMIEEDVISDVMKLPPGTVVVHGDEPTGVDAIARDTARDMGLVDEAHPPDLKAHRGNFRDAALARNAYVTTVGADGEARFFASPSSRGTWDAYRKAERANVPRILREYRYDGGVKITRWPEVQATKMMVKTGNVRTYTGPGKLDVTRGSGRGDGLCFAPTEAILKPALAERERTRPFFVKATQLMSRIRVTEEQKAEAAKLQALGWEIEDAAWAAYEPRYIAEMRVSAGLVRGSPKWGPLEEEAWARGVRSHRETWRDLLAGKLGSYDRDGAPTTVLCCFCGGSFKLHCHAQTLRRLVVAMGAEDGGEAKGQGFGHVCMR